MIGLICKEKKDLKKETKKKTKKNRQHPGNFWKNKWKNSWELLPPNIVNGCHLQANLCFVTLPNEV